MAGLRDQIGGLSAGLDRIDCELQSAEQTVKEREWFQAEHAPDSGRLDSVQSELDRHIAHRVEHRLTDPTDYHLAILGPAPADPDHRTIWKRGAAILEAHHLGADTLPADTGESSLFGSRREAAEIRARLEAVTTPQRPEPRGIKRGPSPGLGLGL